MTLAEKITRAKTDYDNVFDAGYEKGKAEGGGSGGGTSTTNVLAKALLPKMTSFESMFNGYSDMTDEDLAFAGFTKENTSQVTTVRAMFTDCSQITTLPEMDLSNCTDMIRFAQRCSNLKSVPMYNTRNVKSFESVLQLCRELVDGPCWDARNVTSFYSAFSWCDKMTNLGLKNIKVNLDLATCSALQIDSCINLVRECINTGSTRTIYFPRKLQAQIGSIYIKPIEITDEMREEDDLIGEKSPFEVCDSTDDGAILLTNYAPSKNWNIAFT